MSDESPVVLVLMKQSLGILVWPLFLKSFLARSLPSMLTLSYSDLPTESKQHR